jgi:UPF0271 protein
MKFVLDASFFFAGAETERLPRQVDQEMELYTTPEVVDEVKDLSSRCRLEALTEAGLKVITPSKEACHRIDLAAGVSGDRPVLSQTDTSLLSLALDLVATLVTDDFAVQNTAKVAGVATAAIQQRKARYRRWRFRCSGCGRYYDEIGECQVCGAEIKRKLK